MVRQLSKTEEEDSDMDMDARLEYIERYHELLDNKEYNHAAIHAANSPQGILRTSKTLHRLAGNPTTTTTAAVVVYYYTVVVAELSLSAH